MLQHVLVALALLTWCSGGLVDRTSHICSVCSCSSNLAIDCSRLQLTAVDTGAIPWNATALTLSYNPIQHFALAHPLPRLTSLSLSSTLITSLSATVSGEFLPNLKQLICGQAELINIELGALQHMPALQEVWMPSNPLVEIPRGTFANCTLQTLVLTACAFPTLPDDLFRSTTDLLYLHLDYNMDLRYLPDSLLLGLTSLRTLSFKGTGLLHFPSFQSLHSLDKLVLSDCNRLQPLSPDTLVGLTQLTSIELDGSSFVPSFPPAFLAPLVGLTDFSADGLAIDEVDDDIFSTNMALTSIILSQCALRSLPRVDHLRALTSLDVGTNRATELPSLQGLSNLASLFASDNHLTVTPNLSNLTSLTTIHLENNQLTALPASSFENLPSVTLLSVSHNPIQAVDDTVFASMHQLLSLNLGATLIKRVPQLHTLVQLRYITLGPNPHITSLAPNLFSNLTALQLINLDGIAITSLDERFFIDQQNSVTTLELSNTLLTRIPAAVRNLTSLASFSMDVTPLTTIECNELPASSAMSQFTCNMCLQLRTIAPGAFAGVPRLLSMSFVQSGLEHIQAGVFVNLPQLNQLLFTHSLALRTIAAPTASVPTFDLPALTTLMLNNCSLQALPCGLFSRLPQLFSVGLTLNRLSNFSTCHTIGLHNFTELSLAGNAIEFVPDDTFASMTFLQALDLSANELIAIPFGLPTSLRYLRLALNRIFTVDLPALEPLTQLRVLDLSYNRVVFETIQHVVGALPPSLHSVNLAFNQIRGSFTIPPLLSLDLSSNQLTSVQATHSSGPSTLLGTISLGNNDFQPPACPPGMYGTLPNNCDGFCSPECTNAGLFCSGPGPRDCCSRNSYTGPQCQYLASCHDDSVCGPFGTCVQPLDSVVSLTFNLTCVCQPPLLAYAPTSSRTLALSNVPQCLSECDPLTMYADMNLYGSPSCVDCDVSCSLERGCTGPGVSGCVPPPTHKIAVVPIAVSTGISAVFLIALALGLAWRVRAEGRARRKDASEYSRLLDDVNNIWEIKEADLKYDCQVARGGFGTIWLAEYLGHEVAVKKLTSAVVETDAQSMDDFLLELSFLKGMRHRNIVLFFGGGREEHGSEGMPFIVLEWMAQGSLRGLLDTEQKHYDEAETRLSWDVRLSIASDIARGMLFLHTREVPVVHLDLKSLNVLVNSKWQAKISDFGESRALSKLRTDRYQVDARQKQGDSATMSNAVTTRRGTMGWRAPEIERGDVYNLSADVFSYGMVLYEIASGRVPFEDIRVWDVAEAVMAGERPATDQLMGVPSAFIAVMQSCWAHLPENRPLFRTVLGDLDQIDATFL